MARNSADKATLFWTIVGSIAGLAGLLVTLYAPLEKQVPLLVLEAGVVQFGIEETGKLSGTASARGLIGFYEGPNLVVQSTDGPTVLTGKTQDVQLTFEPLVHAELGRGEISVEFPQDESQVVSSLKPTSLWIDFELRQFKFPSHRIGCAKTCPKTVGEITYSFEVKSKGGLQWIPTKMPVCLLKHFISATCN